MFILQDPLVHVNKEGFVSHFYKRYEKIRVKCEFQYVGRRPSSLELQTPRLTKFPCHVYYSCGREVQNAEPRLNNVRGRDD